MSSVCLSQVPILRCIDLRQLESGLLLIPPGLEVVFSLGLMIAGAPKVGKKRFLLAAEGPVYFVLALLEFLYHFVPGIQDSLSTFKAIDIAIGALSFAPILLYTSFLFLYKITQFFPEFPQRFQLLGKVFSLALIPVLLITNEFASFVGIDYQIGLSPSGLRVLAIGLRDNTQDIRSFLNSLGLVLLTIYQAATFFIVLLRLTKAVLAQRNIEVQVRQNEETHLFRGTGWIALGVKLGFAETVIGFASGSFGLFFTRRFLKMLSRACLIIGVVRGPDSHEDFEIMNPSPAGTIQRSLSTRQLNISNPLLISSTMVERDPERGMRSIGQPVATFARGIPRASFQSLITLSTTVPPSVGPSSGLDSALSPQEMPPVPPLLSSRRGSYDGTEHQRSDSGRVTVQQGRNRAPTLVLRLSGAPFPSYDAIMTAGADGAAGFGAGAHHPPNASRFSVSTVATEPPPRRAPPWRASAGSITSDSREYVRSLSQSFPSLPPRVTGKFRGSVLGVVADLDEPAEPVGVALARGDSSRTVGTVASEESARTVSRKPPPTYEESVRADSPTRPQSQVAGAEVESEDDEEERLDDEEERLDAATLRRLSDRSTSGQWVSPAAALAAAVARPQIQLDIDGYRRGRGSAPLRRGSSGRTQSTKTSLTPGALDIDWLANPEIGSEADEAWRARIGRIKSVGRAPRHRTPPPTADPYAYARGSVAAETVLFPDAVLKSGDGEGSEGAASLVRQDSGVLGAEDSEIVRGEIVKRHIRNSLLV